MNVDPNSLLARDIPLPRVVEAIRQGNADVGGRLVELGGAEYMVRGRGYARSVRDIEQIVVGDSNGVPVLVRDVARVALGPDIRRGVVDLDGIGDTAGGIVVMALAAGLLAVSAQVGARAYERRDF